MVITFTDLFGISKELFHKTGAYDSIIGIDSRLFIDPALLDLCEQPEFVGARKKVEDYFGVIITLLSKSGRKGDTPWKRAEKLLSFTEIRGTCLGYCSGGNAGAGIGPELRKTILESVRLLIDAGITNPTIFELLGVFEEGVGADRISDLLAHILRKEIAQYTARVADDVGFTADTTSFEGYRVPKHPARMEPILLLPQSILSPLPIAMEMEDIDHVCAVNERVRDVINSYFPWHKETDGKKRTVSKAQIKWAMQGSPGFAEAILEAYREMPHDLYDFDRDSNSVQAWYQAGKALTEQYPLEMKASCRKNPVETARTICRHFKHLVEDKGAWKLLYNEHENRPRTERYAQYLFFVIAETYCEANHDDIDVSPESNSGNGPVDFKLSHGRGKKCLVELKMSSSGRLKHCIETQIPAYMQAEDAQHAMYLLIQTGNEERVEELNEYYREQPDSIRSSIELTIVDARPKISASKR